ncbi:MAG: glycosyltransferase family 4 protein [Prevotella sp.]|nr:glycosyltransferase family 4 protein [Prevotella sp.]
MKIIIIANFPSALNGKEISGRFLYLGEMLCERGHQVEMIISDFNHETKSHRAEGSINHQAYQTKITVLHEPGYPNNVSIKRLWSHYQWGLNVGRYLKSIEKPDVVYCALPSLTAGVKASKYCKKHGVRFVIDVQDLWPEAFETAIRNKLLQKVFLPIRWYVNKAYRAADTVVAVSETYAARALSVNKKTDKGVIAFLGKDKELFDEFKQSGKVYHAAVSPSAVCPSTSPSTSSGTVSGTAEGIVKIAYVGSLGYSYDLPGAIRAIDICQRMDNMPHLQFVVMGRGPLRKKFEDYAREVGIDCVFTGFMPFCDLVATMCSCDIVVNPILECAAQSITNKVGDYALSGLPVVNSQLNPEYRQLLDDYHCGINCKVADAEDMARALATLIKDPALRKEMGANARKLGEEKFDRRTAYQKIVKMLES